MDLIGLRPDGPEGTSFVIDDPQWLALRSYLEDATEEDLEANTVPHEKAAQIALILKTEILRGSVEYWLLDKDPTAQTVWADCHDCGGTQSVLVTYEDGEHLMPCPACDGSGEVFSHIHARAFQVDDVADLAEFMASSGGFAVPPWPSGEHPTIYLR